MVSKTNILITGAPGSGKSTLLERVMEKAEQQELAVGGISTPEFRLSNGRRGGFLIRDVATGTEQIMAGVDVASPFRVGRYGVEVQAILEVGVTAIDAAVSTADLVLIDEIGKMELIVPEFRQSVLAALDSSKPVLGTIGLRLRIPFAEGIKRRPDLTLLTITPYNRNQLYTQICTKLEI
ncbi:MAG: NTPase [Candidatus Hermodarchaeota archaeon]|nr:NTPase [Candidatus Hermodarchaeota archaeon]